MAKKILLVGVIISMTAWFFVNDAQASSLTVNNFSFEANTVSDGGTTSLHNSWVFQGASGGTASATVTFNPTNAQFDGATGSPGTLASPAHGSQCLTNLGSHDTAVTCVFYGGGLEANSTYIVTMALGFAKDRPFGGISAGLIDYMAGIGGSDHGAPYWSPNNGDGTWVDWSFSVSSDEFFSEGGSVGDVLGLYIGFGYGVMVDNVRVDVIPEPSMMTLLATGVIGMMVYVRRKRD